jgi:hypothetical protein
MGDQNLSLLLLDGFEKLDFFSLVGHMEFDGGDVAHTLT